MIKAPTAAEVLDLLEAGAASAAVGAAVELGLFWMLAERALPVAAVAEALQIPPARCGHWLRLLSEVGVLERSGPAYRTSTAARAAVLDAHSRPTWALLAEEARERLTAFTGLPVRLQSSGPMPPAGGGAYARMATDVEAARRFTRMLCELHRPLARDLAERLDLAGVVRLMDLGGGSGVVSMEIARRHPSIVATVVDIENVCTAGREIAAAEGLAGRVSFHAADMLCDPLPSGFDVVLECDVNVYTGDLARKVRDALRPGGRYLIVDHLAAEAGEAPASRVHWALARSMADAGWTPPTIPSVRLLLESAGFRSVSVRRFEAGRDEGDLAVVEGVAAHR